MAQNRQGRRGAVFSVRVTDEERAQLEEYQAQGGGPRALGPWIVWRALTAGAVLPGPGTTSTAPAIERVLPPPARTPSPAVPARGGSTRTQVLPRRGGVLPAQRERLILDLCGGSGSWSRPYAEAGYRVQLVTLPDHDVRTYIPPAEPVWGIVAAPPCDQFSLARNGHARPEVAPRDFLFGMECVNACLRIVLQCRPQWWALENPVGLLSQWLGTPRDVFEPCDYGDPWTKRTALWGDFAIPTRGPFVAPLGGGRSVRSVTRRAERPRGAATQRTARSRRRASRARSSRRTRERRV